MLTAAAHRSVIEDGPYTDAVVSLQELIRAGWTASQVRNQIRARRWQRIGRAVICHNAAPTDAELRKAARIVLGPRAVLAAFTALDDWGLAGWERPAIHVLVPRGARVVRPSALRLRVHYTDSWRSASMNLARGLQRPVPAALLAASTLPNARPACGILAAVVQQRLARPGELVRAVTEASRIRHRALLLSAARDIGQGAEALSEIDFARLCRRAGLPQPVRQAVRVERSGRRRYLDAEWTLPNGRRLVAEVDGALHLVAQRWWADQLRQNELVIAGDTVLRYPSVVVRCEEALIVDQLRRALWAG